jgi:hypothetical protein
MQWLGILLMTVLLAGGPGYASAQQAGKPETSPTPQPISSGQVANQAQSAKSYSQAERQAYEEKTAKDLEAMQRQLAELRGKQGKIKPQARRLVLKSMLNLQRGLSQTQALFDSMKKASGQAWGETKAKLDSSMATWTRDYAVLAARLQ